jgi:hypothetical protein
MGFEKNDRAAVDAVRTIKYNLFQSCVTLEKMQRLHHQFQEIVLSWIQLISFVLPHSH